MTPDYQKEQDELQEIFGGRAAEVAKWHGRKVAQLMHSVRGPEPLQPGERVRVIADASKISEKVKNHLAGLPGTIMQADAQQIVHVQLDNKQRVYLNYGDVEREQ